MSVIVDIVSIVSAVGRESATAIKLESEVDAEDGRREDIKHQELKLPNLRSNQVEAKDDVGPVSTFLSQTEIQFL